MKRRDFISLGAAAGAGLAGLHRLRASKCAAAEQPGAPRRILFSTHGKIGLINEDGTGERILSLDIPNQASWGPGPFFSDNRRMLITSYESGATWKGNVHTRLWTYDFSNESLTEIVLKNRPAEQVPVAAILPGDQRIVTGPIIDGEERVMIMNLDGTDPVDITRKGDGFAYCVQVSPDAKRLAFHITGKKPYRIMVTDIDGSNRIVAAEHPEHLYFGPMWSKDGKRLLYQDCHVLNKKLDVVDPGHDWSDLCIGTPDGPNGPENRVITKDQSCWFAASYGNPKIPETVSSGSNLPVWSPDGAMVTWIRRSKGARTPWQWATDRPDKDHFNRDFLPDKSRGGVRLCLLNPSTGTVSELTSPEPHRWDCYPAFSPDGKKIAFSRARDGDVPHLWIMDADGGNARLLTRGDNGMGAKYPRFF
jgi:Tol biopolymer transport system component